MHQSCDSGNPATLGKERGATMTENHLGSREAPYKESRVNRVIRRKLILFMEMIVHCSTHLQTKVINFE